MNFKLQSDEVDKLTAAFIEASKEFPPFEADTKSRFGKPFISINGIKSNVWDILKKHGIKIRQGRVKIDGEWAHFTQLTHLSGQWERSFAPQYLPENPQNGIDQALGSSMSYQRRYDLYGLFGILGEDNDPDSMESPAAQSAQQSYEPKLASDAQVKLLTNLLMGNDEVKREMRTTYKINSLSELTSKVASEYISRLKEPKGS